MTNLLRLCSCSIFDSGGNFYDRGKYLPKLLTQTHSDTDTLNCELWACTSVWRGECTRPMTHETQGSKVNSKNYNEKRYMILSSKKICKTEKNNKSHYTGW